jgi:hypothetical protein
MTSLDRTTQEFSGIQRAAPDSLEHDAISARARRARWAGRVSLALPALGAAAGAWLALRGPEQRSTGLGLLGAAAGLGLLRWQLQRLVTENVPYRLEATLGDVELRHYPAQVWAETLVEHSTWEEALSAGFERLAGYIFGENSTSERLSMTAPVLGSLPAAPRTAQPIPAPETIVTTGGDAAARLSRTVSFVMPADRSLSDLPQPNDARVLLRAVPARYAAALVFSGDYRSDLPERKRAELLRRLQEAGISPKGAVRFAGYDPPTTLPALRRNEVLAELDESAAP